MPKKKNVGKNIQKKNVQTTQLPTEKKRKVNFRIKEKKELPKYSLKGLPSEVETCIGNYRLNLFELTKLKNLDDYLMEKGVDDECMDIINMHISRVPPPDRPPLSFLVQLASCHKFLVDSGLGDDDTTSEDLNNLLKVVRDKISEEGMSPDNAMKLHLLEKCYTAYSLYGL